MRNYGQRIDPEAVPEIAKRLRLLRKAVADSPTHLSAVTGITRSAWSNYETGFSRIGVDAAMRLVDAFGPATGIGLDWIYRNDETLLRANFRDQIRAIEAEEEAGGARKSA
jgi:transcriptional regulator with XRE-family HTH domain